MPPIFVDGVEIKTLFVDGVQQQEAWADGVQVFSAFESEDYYDDFTTDPIGTLTVNHLLNTGQSWNISFQDPAAPSLQAAIGSLTGNFASSLGGPAGAYGFNQNVNVSFLNPSFMVDAFYAWQPIAGVQSVTMAYYIEINPNSTIFITGILGGYGWTVLIDGVIIDSGTFPDNQDSGHIEVFFDGTDIATAITVFPSGQRAVMSRRSANGMIPGPRSFSATSVGSLGAATTAQVSTLSETGVPPEQMPWPT
jgi:hypothetical protein